MQFMKKCHIDTRIIESEFGISEVTEAVSLNCFTEMSGVFLFKCTHIFTNPKARIVKLDVIMAN